MTAANTTPRSFDAVAVLKRGRPARITVLRDVTEQKQTQASPRI